VACSTGRGVNIGHLLYKPSPQMRRLILALLQKKNWLEFLSFNGVRIRLFIVDLDNTIEAAVFSLHQSLAGSRNRVGLL
jgi:hypothetical protein